MIKSESSRLIEKYLFLVKTDKHNNEIYLLLNKIALRIKTVKVLNPDSSLRYPWKDKQHWAQTDTKQVLYERKKTLQQWGGLNSAGCSESLQSLHVGDTQNMTGHGPWATCSSWHGLRRVFGFPEVPSSLNYSVILWEFWS